MEADGRAMGCWMRGPQCGHCSFFFSGQLADWGCTASILAVLIDQSLVTLIKQVILKEVLLSTEGSTHSGVVQNKRTAELEDHYLNLLSIAEIPSAMTWTFPIIESSLSLFFLQKSSHFILDIELKCHYPYLLLLFQFPNEAIFKTQLSFTEVSFTPSMFKGSFKVDCGHVVSPYI